MMENDANPLALGYQDPTRVAGEGGSASGSALAMLLEAEQMLRSHDYELIPPSVVGTEQHERLRVLEDAYGVVLLQCFDSVDALLDLWEEAQSLLVKALTDHMMPGAARGWEGYLVLMTPASALARDLPALMALRYDTTRTRKLLITGAARLHRGLAPILPLPEQTAQASADDSLDYVVEWLGTSGVTVPTARVLLDAYRNQQSLFEALEAVVLKQLGEPVDGEL
jgi:hypothetical protein